MLRGGVAERASAEIEQQRWARVQDWCARWVALPLLLLLFELPSLALPEPVRPTGELVLLLGGWWLSLRLRPRLGPAMRWLLALCCIALVVARLDRVVFLQFMGQEPLFYDQLFMLRHLFVLFGDLWSWTVAAVILAAVLASVLVVWSVRFLLRRAAKALEPEQEPQARWLGPLLAAFVLLGSFLPWGPLRALRWMTPALVDNIQESYAIYTGVQRQLGRSPYRGYGSLVFSRKPDIYLILVESYGRVITQRSTMRRGWSRQVRRMQRTLSAAGWYSASGFSRAPVMGGRSWLAEGSVLMGINVRYEAVFHHLIDQIARVPNLVSLLAAQGYHTILLGPSDRKRPGVEAVNYYRYQRCVRFGDLGYRGPQIGWGIVPDQYSLGYTDEHVLRRTPHPLFFDFHMVSSHAPWEDVPTLVPDWRWLNVAWGEPIDDPVDNSTLMRLRRYIHNDGRFPSAGALSDQVGQRYQATILYDLALLERYLSKLEGDALVIVIGDHQPPFIATETRSFDTPVHVFARDPRLLLELKDHGFKDGLWLSPTEATAVNHEGLFSLLVRTLVRCCGVLQQLPAYRPDGVELGG